MEFIPMGTSVSSDGETQFRSMLNRLKKHAPQVHSQRQKQFVQVFSLRTALINKRVSFADIIEQTSAGRREVNTSDLGRLVSRYATGLAADSKLRKTSLEDAIAYKYENVSR